MPLCQYIKTLCCQTVLPIPHAVTLYLFDPLQKGDELIQRKHESSPEIHRQTSNLVTKWNELLKASADRGKGLEEAKDILKFNEECDKVEAWIRDKVSRNYLSSTDELILLVCAEFTEVVFVL